ncbi:MAG: hypothetical protein EZS28_032057, partial [Streblomastix strix]
MQWTPSQPNTKSRNVGTTHTLAIRGTNAQRPVSAGMQQQSLQISTPQVGQQMAQPLVSALVQVQPRTSISSRSTRDREDENERLATQTYIANLQGQIHLLELEAQLLKEKVNEGGAQLESKTVGTDLDLVQTTTLDPPMRELRSLYQKLERDYKEDRVRMQAELDELINEKIVIQSQADRSKKDMEEMQEEIKRIREDCEEQKRPNRRQIVVLEQTIRSLQEEKQRYSVERERHQDQLQNEIQHEKELESKIEELNSALRQKDMSTAPLKKENQNQLETITALKKEIEQIQFKCEDLRREVELRTKENAERLTESATHEFRAKHLQDEVDSLKQLRAATEKRTIDMK